MKTFEEVLVEQSGSGCHIGCETSSGPSHNFFVLTDKDEEKQRFQVMGNTIFPEHIEGEFFINLSFSQALTALASGHRITRDCWARGRSWVETRPRDTSNLNASKLVITFPNKKGAFQDLWYPSANDLFATDWRVLPD